MNEIESFYFKSPSTSTVAGPTGCGKTYLLFEILRHRGKIFEKHVDDIIWCYSSYQDVFNNYPHIRFHQGLFDVAKIAKNKHTVLVIDDLMHRVDRSVAETFTVHSHHNNVTVFFLTQNLFHQNRFMRDITLNTQYLFLFGQRRDISQVNTLATQMFPLQRKAFLKIYKEVTSKPHRYLLCDLHPGNKLRVLLRTRILPGEVDTVYIPE